MQISHNNMQSQHDHLRDCLRCKLGNRLE